MQITKDMLITDIIAADESIAGILMNMGMHCIGCMAASGESLEQAMYVHGYADEDVDSAVKALNAYLSSREKDKADA